MRRKRNWWGVAFISWYTLCIIFGVCAGYVVFVEIVS